MLANGNLNISRTFQPGHSHHSSLSSLPSVVGFQYRGLSTAHHGPSNGLPKIETSGLSLDHAGGLRTAPPYGGFGAELGTNSFGFGPGLGSTINPNAIHLNGLHGLGIDPPSSPLYHMFPGSSNPQGVVEDENQFDWMTQGFDGQMSFVPPNESAVETSSPSAMSTNSPSGISEVMLDGSGTVLTHLPVTSAPLWTNLITTHNQMVTSPMNMDFPTSTFNEMLPAPIGTISPKSLLAQSSSGLDMGFPTPPLLSSLDPSSALPGFTASPYHFPLGRTGGGASTASTASGDSSLRQSSVTTASSELINEHIRGILMSCLAQNAGFGHHKYSQPTMSSPLSPVLGNRNRTFSTSNFPSAQDLQRYVSAYIQYFHPHLPFLHIPSLNFDSPEYSIPFWTSNNHPQFAQNSIAGGGGCLILSISAIGALYEHDPATSKELFDSAKRLVNNYLEERRKANISNAQYGNAHASETEDTPLWLVQAMLLNVIYGHNCGDKTAADIASNHCAALVSLGRGADLARPYPGFMGMNGLDNGIAPHDVHMAGMSADRWNSIITEPDDSDWHAWKVAEERKRTLYAVFILSSLLVSAYNHAPALTNSEIRLDLPCDEEFWSAENAQVWRTMGGAAMSEAKLVTFGAALGHLLTAAQRQQRRSNNSVRAGGADLNSGEQSESELKPSTFGCLILVNALHNYIWETRQRHLGRQWTIQETEQMHAHIEPALRAWQAAWASNPSHSLERPNPFGAGPLSADSIPLLDLAYVRLFVNLGRSKEAFWQRDFDAMAKELARGSELMQQAEQSPESVGTMSTPNSGSNGSISRRESIVDIGEDEVRPLKSPNPEQYSSARPHNSVSRRERYLRKAAFYAADSLLISDKLGLSFAEHTSRELPLQSAMCLFDCAQVVAEWITSVQERVGRYIGIIGKDEIDYQGVPSIMLFEDEDRKLLDKIHEVLHSAEQKVRCGSSNLVPVEGGYGSEILMITARMLENSAVWPGESGRLSLEKRTPSLTVSSHKIDGTFPRDRSCAYEGSST